MTTCRAPLTDGSEIEFDTARVTGAGGEKTAFLSSDGARVVLLFNQKLRGREERIDRLNQILRHYNPTIGPNADFWRAHFCWPEGIISGTHDIPEEFLRRHGLASPALGVVVPVIPGNFYFRDRAGNTHLKSGKWFTGPKARKFVPADERGTLAGFLQCGTMIARATRRLHRAGLAHGDLSSKNVIIDPRKGRACVIDLDSLVVPGISPPVVSGTHGYIAPEVVAGRAQPSIETDLHALAVLIYETLLARHPLIGPKKRSDDVEECERLEFGSDALFVEHPDDRSNRLAVPPVMPFTRLGPHLAPLMRRAFIEGLHRPGQRPTAEDWETAFYRTADLLHPSPDGHDWIILGPGQPMKCPFTRAPLTEAVPYATFFRRAPSSTTEFLAEPSGHGLTVYHGLRLMPWHVFTALPPEQIHPEPLGYFVRDQGCWYLVNESEEIMMTHEGYEIGRNGFVEIKDGLSLVMSSAPNARLLRFGFLAPRP